MDLQSQLAYEAYGSREAGVGPCMEEMSRPMLQRKVQVCHQVFTTTYSKSLGIWTIKNWDRNILFGSPWVRVWIRKKYVH